MDRQTPPYLLTDIDDRIVPRWRRALPFALFVLLPTLLAAIWLYGFAADQYESRAQFLVRSADGGTPSIGAGGLAQMIGLGAGSAAAGEVKAVAAYLTSHDAAAAADERLGLTAIFRRPEADLLSRLWDAEPSAEDLAEHYEDRVKVFVDPDTGIANLTVHTYRAADSKALADTLLALGEDRVNALNARAGERLLDAAREQLALAEGELARVGAGIASYRRREQQVDPETSGAAQVELSAGLRAELAELRAQERAMAGALVEDSPQRVALRRRIAALAGEVAGAEAVLAGRQDSLSARVGDYEDLRLRQEFAAKRYELAAAAYEEARDQALRQNLFVVRVVEPNLPDEALYPKRATILLTIFAGLTLAYGIGWLLLAGVREHAA